MTSSPPTTIHDPAGWQPETIARALEAAADTLRRLPSAMHRPRLNSWPSIVRSAAEAGSYRPAAPSPRQIDEMDLVLEWLLWLDPAVRPLVWARACHLPWRRLEQMMGRSHVTLRKQLSSAYQLICRQLNAQTT
jgi:Domain of unknown function (DUF6362)